MPTNTRLCKVPRRQFKKANSETHSDETGQLPTTVPILGLGCSSFSKFFFRPSDDDANSMHVPLTNPPSKEHPIVQAWIATIRHAVLDRGITLLDTAPWYGHGMSEVVVGYAIETLLLPHKANDGKDDSGANDTDNNSNTQRIARNDLIINTKVGRYEADPSQQFDFSAARVLPSVLTSIERLQCDYIDVLQLHDPEFTPSVDMIIDETIPAMAKLRDQDHLDETTGKSRRLVKAIGITGYPLDLQKEIVKRSWEEHGIRIDQSLTYGHFNLHDQSLFFPMRDETQTKVEAENATSTSCKDESYYQYCSSNRIPVMAAAPLSMGLLTDAGPLPWHPASPPLRQACAAAASLCQDMKGNVSDLALVFALSDTRIPCTILGMKNVDEVEKACRIAMRFQEQKSSAELADGRVDSPTYSIQQKENPYSVFHQVATPEEELVLERLLDFSEGPFGTVHKNGTYFWDGHEEGEKFWSQVEGGKQAGLQRMRGASKASI